MTSGFFHIDTATSCMLGVADDEVTSLKCATKFYAFHIIMYLSEVGVSCFMSFKQDYEDKVGLNVP